MYWLFHAAIFRRPRKLFLELLWVNSIEGPELALCDWKLFSAMQRTSSSDRCKKTGTKSRSCM
jgi:hypothetical protein